MAAKGDAHVDARRDARATRSKARSNFFYAASKDRAKTAIDASFEAPLRHHVFNRLLELAAERDPATQAYCAAALRGRPPRRPFARELAALRALVEAPAWAASRFRM